MKKLLAFAVSAIMLLSFAGCSNSAEKSNKTEAQTQTAAPETESNENNKTTDKIIIGLDENFPPMGFRDENNEITGFDVDLAKAAAEKMGVEAEFQPINWSSKELELDSGKVDLLWNGLTITDERRENMEFTNPYLANKQVIMVKNESEITSKADLAGKNIGIQKESSAVDAVNADPIASELNLNEYDDNILAFTDLEIGRVDAVVVDEIVARYYISTNDTDFKLLDEDFGDEVYGVAAKKGNTELINKLQAALDEIKDDGTAAEISQKWFGEDIYLH